MNAKCPTIFYDLETSDLSPVGQIMNFCFTVVDNDFTPQDSLQGAVKLSRLQLPRAAAIAANKIDVLKHQESAKYSEAEAMCVISKFINDLVTEYGEYNIALVGYNSSRFDLDFLRTSLIRNGINPYFKVRHKDLLFCSRKLAVSKKNFPRLSSIESPDKLSLRLETLCQAFGLLTGSQAHESSDDVRLTIELAKYFNKEFQLDVRDYLPYEVQGPLHREKGLILKRLIPSYDLSKKEIYEDIPYALLDSNYRYALWINLNRYRDLIANNEEPANAIEFFKMEGSDFIIKEKSQNTKDLCDTAAEALEKLASINLQNYFRETDCDIEAHIYRLDQNQISALGKRLWKQDESAKLSDDAKLLQVRFKMANAKEGTPGLDARLKDYALYRYGGRMKLNRYSEAVYEQGVEQEGFHPSFEQMLKELREIAEVGDDETKELMQSLMNYYNSTTIGRFAKGH
ncbi:MAG: hypothetical protein GYA55_06225 [SAR324 cluster bacterium]|uniref:Exonuclease domain-containing protein n=1 Tax=SAR324 cluster bacterium TaxID=2024889 RepID=A0A7X9FR19_9DELT|nr:hypothetical protein [SAR324 cluster bacterium]